MRIVGNPKALILGGNGYIGRHLFSSLSSSGWDVNSYGRDKSIDSNDERLGFDVVFFLIGVNGPSASFNAPKEFIANNITTLADALSIICRWEKKPLVVYPSTRLIYKGSNSRLREGSLREPRSIYAWTKKSAEDLLSLYRLVYGLDSLIYRLGVIYGGSSARDLGYGTVRLMIDQAVSGGIRLYGDGLQKRTFTHVHDVCIALRRCHDFYERNITTVNVPGEVFSLLEVARIIAKEVDVPISNTSWPSFAERIESGSTVFCTELYERIISNEESNEFENWIRSLRLGESVI